jgi:phage gp29-like protein
VTGKVPDLEKQIRYYDEQIGRGALTHFLNLGGDDSTGSYALGDTFANFFTKSLNSRARHIATTVQQHVIEDLVDANWGSSEPAPRLVPPKIGAEHPATADAIRALLEAGAIRWNPALEAHLRALYGLPVMDENDLTPPQPRNQPQEAAA